MVDKGFLIKVAKTVFALAYVTSVAVIFSFTINTYLTVSEPIEKIGYWYDGNNFIYSKLIDTIDRINTGLITYRNVSASNASSLNSFDYWDDKYYVTDYSGQAILEFDSSWKLQSTEDMSPYSPLFIKKLDGTAYLATSSGLAMYSSNITRLGWFSLYNDPGYGIYFDLSTYTLVCTRTSNVIEIYNLNLQLVRTIPIPYGTPGSVYGYDGKYYVSTFRNGTSGVVTIKDNQFLGYFEIANKCQNGEINQLLIDEYGFIAIVCGKENAVYIYHHSEVYTGRSLKISAQPAFVNYDQNGRFIIVTTSAIHVYNSNYTVT